MTALAVTFTVSGCATKGTPYQTPASQAAAAAASAAATAPTVATSPLPTASMTPLAAAAGQLTGTQLSSVLLPASDFPAGFTEDSSGPITSGGSLSTSAASYKLATVSCTDFTQNFGNTGFGETAMASDNIVGDEQAYDQIVYQFATAAEASAFVTGIAPIAARCGSFTASDDGSSGTFSLKAADGIEVGGHPTVELEQAGSLGGTPLVIDTLLSASGVDVFAASAVGAGAGAPAVPARETIVYDLMKRQAAAALLG